MFLFEESSFGQHKVVLVIKMLANCFATSRCCNNVYFVVFVVLFAVVQNTLLIVSEGSLKFYVL